MTRRKVPAPKIPERRPLRPAAIIRIRTARLERAARRQIDWTWDLPLEQLPVTAPLMRIRFRNRVQQVLRIGVQRPVVQQVLVPVQRLQPGLPVRL